ncbi:AMP-binding enzyme [Geosmithia morbida]|uniref:AMP-binding enzyme n=1 Tax=Geosmithia morbida TaxID=1094350 RepID=A0A9P4YR76_9HYPO|nr:AMP-binding enzyme [Geosmithia morbida]KAF4120116.1 AMP-binding enzyme [Geosmithia morbida]
MPFASPYPPLDFPYVNILDYLFGQQPVSDDPLWFDCKEPSRNLSTAQLLQWVKRLGYGLERLGLRRGDVIMICTPNQIFVPVAYLGIVGSGYIFSGANPTYTESELVHQLTDTTAKVLLVHPAMLSRMIPAANKAGVPQDRIFQFSDEPNPVHNGIVDWRDIAGNQEQGNSWKWPELGAKEAAETVATINYSSGTTGLPKGVCVSHRNLVAKILQTIFVRYVHKPYPFEKRPQERWIGFLPLYHAYGQLYTILMAIKLKFPIYIMAEFRYEDFLSAIEKYRITTLQVAPPILVMLSKRPETARYDLSSLKEILCGAAPLSRELQNECQSRFGVQVNQGWGMTEVTCGALHVPGGINDTSGSVGLLDPNCECRLVDESGNDVEIGRPGEMLIRGPNVCMGYWRNEEASKENLNVEGWLKTGDIAICDKRGYFWIVDRKKELIKVKGLQVAPAELEAVLLENEAIADAAVVGINLDGNEWPRAYVVIQETAKDATTPKGIQEWIKSRVAKHKQLSGGVAFVDEVPKLASGKIQRKTMREWAKRDATEVRKSTRAKL